MRFSNLVVFVAATLLLVSCGKKESSDKAKEKAPAATVDSKDNPADKAPSKAAAGTPASSSGDDVSAKAACALITQADATATLGEEAKPGTPGAAGCIWEASSGGMKFVSVGLRDAAMWDQAKKISKDMAEQSKKTFEELPGLGDDAFFIDVAGLQVIVKAGKRYAELSMVGPNDAAAKERLLELAKKLAPKL